MRIDSLAARTLAIPFKTAFKHSAAERHTTQTLWVTATGGGCTGHGEGCPREYVTGEGLDSALAFFERYREEWLASINDLKSLRRWVEGHEEDIDRNAAAWCAVELALLDLLAKTRHCSIEQLLGLPPLSGQFRYSAVLGDSSTAQFAAQLERYRQLGFSAYKIKLAGDPERDREKIAALLKAGIGAAQVRADANNLWANADEAIDYLCALAYPFHALEEPVSIGDYAGMRQIAMQLGTRIILDESLTRAGQLVLLQDTQHWIPNLRVSKLGGLLRSLRLLSSAQGLDLIIGAHVGETSLLTRAALTLAARAKGRLIAQEGAFGTHLLERDVIAAPLTFGHGGLLDIPPDRFLADGWGLGLSSARLD